VYVVLLRRTWDIFISIFYWDTVFALKICILLLAVVPLAAAPTYSLVNLGGMGGSSSDAFALNAFGAVAGTAFDRNETSHGFAYQNSMQQFEADSDARGINAEGSVVGTSQGLATVWKNGTAERLGTLGGDDSNGIAINDFGYVTGASLRADGKRHAFLAANGQLIDLGALGGSWSAGYAINNAGQIAGASNTSSGAYHAFLWDQATGMRDLGTLGGRESRAFALNSSGAVAGAATLPSGQYRAALWSTDGSITNLGTLGGLCSYAYGVNDDGFAVGYSYDGQGRSRAFVWADGMLFDLNDLAQNAPGWSLTAAYGINAAGQIVGTGTFNGSNSAFLLDPLLLEVPRQSRNLAVLSDVPEPSTSLLLAGGALALLCWRKSKLSDKH
jgi:probable HAF family extracellular repeat protein